MDRQLPGDWSAIGQVNSCKVSPEIGCYPGAMMMMIMPLSLPEMNLR